MGLKGLAILVAMLAVTQAIPAVVVQASDQGGANRQSPPLSTCFGAGQQSAGGKPPVSKTPGSQAPSLPNPGLPSPDLTSPSLPNPSLPNPEAESESGDQLQPHITVVNPAPAPSPWMLRDKITWAANLVLVILGYAGILLAVSTLKKIERQTGYAETAAEAALASAQAALLHAQALTRAERPWILISVEPSAGKHNSFTVMATNRGRTPARIAASSKRIKIATDETRLPAVPEYENEEPGALLAPILLLPGEFAVIERFSREDVKGLCESEEKFKRIESWEERVFLYGKVVYRDLTASADDQAYETNWCCWYIHGQKNSAMAFAGPAAYNTHT
jgi:hypothetical protein